MQYAFGVNVEHQADAYSLVNRGGEWYFICNVNGKFSIFPVKEIWSMEILEDTFKRIPDFNLEKFWRNWQDRVSKEDSGFYAEILVTARLMKFLSRASAGVIVSEKETPGGRFASQVTLKFRYFDEARSVLLGYGGAIRVLSPLSLKYAVQDYARQTLKVYED